MGDWIERNLAAESGGGVASSLSDECVCGFMAGRGKEKHHVGDEAEYEEGWSEFRHKSVRLGGWRIESKSSSGTGKQGQTGLTGEEESFTGPLRAFLS